MGLYFFSGKGGVGKTHLAASFALHRAHSGKKVLLVEFSQYAQYAEYFELEIGSTPYLIEKNLRVATWTGYDCLGEYAGRVLRSEKASDFFMKMPLMEKLIQSAPGLKEISVLGKLTSDYREIDFETQFDDIVFDAPSSGHFLSLLSVPQSLAGIVGVGPMRTQCSNILDCLMHSKEVFFALVDDGSVFSQRENQQTQDMFKKIVLGRQLNIIRNFSDGLEWSEKSNWIESAKSLMPYWETFQWKN